MIRKIATLLTLTALITQAFGQETTVKKTTSRPDIPGTFVLELGVNIAPKALDQFDLGFWGSRTLNVYYQYDMRILNSKFSFVPGIGFSMERFKFKNGFTVGHRNDSLVLLPPAAIGLPTLKKSQLITNYFEVPLEICFRTNPDDPARSFKISVGGRVGYLLDSFTKMKYKEDGEVKKLKDKEDFQLSKFRYGVFAKIGAGNFSFFGNYNLTNLFEDGKSPSYKKVNQDFNTWTFGISLASF